MSLVGDDGRLLAVSEMPGVALRRIHSHGLAVHHFVCDIVRAPCAVAQRGVRDFLGLRHICDPFN